MNCRGSLATRFCVYLVAALSLATPVAAQTLSASPGAVNFAYTTGGQAPEPVQVTVTASAGATPTFTAVLLPGGTSPAGLFVLTISPGMLTVGVDRSTLNSIQNSPGLYTVNVSVAATGFPALTIPVTLSIGVALSVQASPTYLVFDMSSGTTSQSVSVTATGGSSVTFTATASTATGGSWLSVSSSLPYTPSTLLVTVTPGSLPAGAYNGTVVIIPSTGGSLTIPVTLQSGPSANLTASPTSFSFSYALGSALPPAQVLDLTSQIPSNTYFARASSTNSWLLVNGVTNSITGTLPAELNITIAPANLTASTYTGSINVTSGDGSTLSIPVTLTLTGGASAIANPGSLTFAAEAGGLPPAAQAILIGGVTPGNFGASVSSGGDWLSVSPATGTAPAQVIATVTPGALAPATYQGNIAISFNGQLVNVGVTLNVSASPVLITSPGFFVFAYTSGSPVPPPTYLTVNTSDLPQQPFAVSATSVPWLQVTSAGTNLTTPSTISLSLNPTGLASGVYLTDIILTPGTAGGVPVTVPVVLRVTGVTSLTASPTSLTFTAPPGGSAQSQTLQVTAGVTTSFTANATTASGENWLTVSPASGTAASAGTSVTVTANPASLAAGTYQGTVLLTTAAGVPTQIPVTLTVATQGLSISPTSLAFAYAVGGATPPSQTVQVTGSQAFTAVANTSTGTWLSVTPSSGSGNATLTVAANPTGLAAGSYSGTVSVTPTGGTAQVVTVTLTVAAPGLTAAPNSLAFNYVAGDTNPASQTLAITSSGTALAFTASAVSSGWLSVSPTSGNTPASLTIAVSAGDLGPGSYSGSISLSAGSGSTPVIVAVTLVVTAPLPVLTTVVNAGSYLQGSVSPGEIIVIFGTDLGPSTGVANSPDSSGFFATSLANVQVTFNGYPAPLLYVSNKQVNAIVPYEIGGASSALVKLLFGQASSNILTLQAASSAPGIFSANSSRYRFGRHPRCPLPPGLGQ